MSWLRALSRPLAGLTHFPPVYRLGQWLGRATVERYQRMLTDQVAARPEEHVLDIGCGVGSHRPCIPGEYTGIDISPEYIATARAGHPGRFEVMDGTALGFEDESFDQVVTVAATHHLSDEQLRAMAREALRVVRPGGFLHVVDAVMPSPGTKAWKRLWFSLDRGGHPRRLEDLRAVLAEVAPVRAEALLEDGWLHDVAYLRVGG